MDNGKTYKLVAAGFGGQGVLSLGQVVAYAGMYDGKAVTWLPSYGPEMRGGTANCSVVVSGGEIASPMIDKPDILVAMNKPSVDKFAAKVAPGGFIFVNSSLIDTKITRDDVTVFYVDTFKIATEAGNPKGLNVVMLAAVVERTGIVSEKNALDAVAYSFKEKPKLIDINLKLYEFARDYIRKH